MVRGDSLVAGSFEFAIHFIVCIRGVTSLGFHRSYPCDALARRDTFHQSEVDVDWIELVGVVAGFTIGAAMVGAVVRSRRAGALPATFADLRLYFVDEIL